MANNVENQVKKIFKHAREGSYATRDKYKIVCNDFARHCHEHFKLNNLRNMSDKHIASYVLNLQERGLEGKTIKTNLGAIRYMHSRIDRPRFRELSDNKQLQKKFDLKFEQVKAVNGNRAWTDSEYRRMQEITHQYAVCKQSVTASCTADTMILARTMGLRVAEAVCVRRSQVEQALRTGIYQVGKEAKNGKPREVPMSPEAYRMFKRRLAVTDRGQRLFVREGEKAHQVVNRIEKFIERHRDKVATVDGVQQRVDLRDGSTRELTMHGLRYSYVQDRMNAEISSGRSWQESAAVVSQEVGHNRVDVIKIYEGGLSESESGCMALTP